MPETMELTAEQKAARNDGIRKLLPFKRKNDRAVITQGILALGPDVVAEAIAATHNFEDFSEDNDPWGEHDMGAFEVSTGDKCFWKIDDYAGHDGIDCVLTILLASEW